MQTHRGPATIVTADGTEHHVDVVLTVTTGEGLTEWWGRVTSSLAPGFPLGDAVLRMGGQEAAIIINHVSAPGTEVTFGGSGAPPL